MRTRPAILVSADLESRGKEFHDLSTSLSHAYQRVLLECGALPFIMPCATSEEAIRDAVARCDGVLLTGGDDVDPRIHRPQAPAWLRAKAGVSPDGGGRDYRELTMLKEVFRQRKPLLAICRGHQLLNVALGGTLYIDLAEERPGLLNHRQMHRRNEPVHEAQLTPGSMLAKIAGRQTLGVNSTHHQAVRKVAGPLTVSAAAADGVVEALEWKRGTAPCPFLLSVQFHPERLAERQATHRAIFEAFIQACA